MTVRKAVDLLDKKNGDKVIQMPKSQFPEHPARFISDRISPTEGHELQLQTRANIKMALAGQFAIVYTEHFQSDFVRKLMDTTMRFGVSMNGEGRKENIDCLRASGSTPDAYFTGMQQGEKRRSFLGIRPKGDGEDDDGI